MPEHPTEEQGHLPTKLRIEYQDSPNNVDPTTNPRFSWRIKSNRRGGCQQSYRLIVGRTRAVVEDGRGDLWDSGRVETNKATNVPYRGPQLASDETYYWSVKVWLDTGESAWAHPETFSTALRPEDWRGEWISHQPEGGDTNGWRSQWRHGTWTGEEWVQVDLGERCDIDAVGLHPAEPIDIIRTPDDTPVTMSWQSNPLAGFGFPDSYRVEVGDSPDFENPTIVSEVVNGSGVVTEGEGRNTGNETVSPVTHENLDIEGRYVRVVATDLFSVSPGPETHYLYDEEERKVQREEEWQCFALAALTVRDSNGSDLARDGTVETSSTANTSTWGREHLVNGHTTSWTACSSPLLRTEFDLDRTVRTARIHVATVGYGELYVNGERIGDGVLDPAWTDYERRVLYSSHDITDHLNEGANALGLWLGRGWFSKSHAYWLSDGSPRGRVALTVEFEDGTKRRFASDSNWRATASPIRENDIYVGETYDARKESRGWASPGFDDANWDCATTVDAPGGTLRPERVEPMGVVDTFEVQEVHDHPQGPILDFGQNLTGWLEVTIRGSEPGDEVTLRHAEALTGDGDLSTTDLRTADATDTYIARGEPTETYEPRFTYHGFRYAQVVDYPGEFDPSDVTAKVVHTAMDRRGEFACSNDDLNQLQQNSVWGLRGNTHSIPEDCPQRDERFGWTGDAHISTRALLFNFDAVRFDEKWARDHGDVATELGYVPDVIPNKDSTDPADPTWSITRVMIPWYLYRHDGDVGILREQYEGMRSYVDYWYSATTDGILPDEYGKFGDWLTFENADGRRGLPHDLYNTAFLYQVIDTFVKIADVLWNQTDAAAYRERAETVADAFNERFFDPDEGVYGPGTQSSYAVPLFMGMVPESKVDLVVENLVKKVESDGGKLRTGFLGTRPMIHTLAEHGHADLAYRVVSQPEQPGWVYMARNGATTMWERWNSDESVGSGMNSLNHSPFAHVSEFFYEVLAGIRLGDEPVMNHVTIAPALVDDLEWVKASVETQTGPLVSEWERTGDGGYHLSVTVPWNGHATVRLPAAAGATVTESGVRVDEESPEGVSSIDREGDELVVEVESGAYEFSVK
jgi:alpha-L-rhamnosidase